MLKKLSAFLLISSICAKHFLVETEGTYDNIIIFSCSKNTLNILILNLSDRTNPIRKMVFNSWFYQVKRSRVENLGMTTTLLIGAMGMKVGMTVEVRMEMTVSILWPWTTQQHHPLHSSLPPHTQHLQCPKT